jgi:hypothetical protein
LPRDNQPARIREPLNHFDPNNCFLIVKQTPASAGLEVTNFYMATDIHSSPHTIAPQNETWGNRNPTYEPTFLSWGLQPKNEDDFKQLICSILQICQNQRNNKYENTD